MKLLIEKIQRRRRRGRAELERRLSNLRRDEERAVEEFEARSAERLHSIISRGERERAHLSIVPGANFDGTAAASASSADPKGAGAARESEATRTKGGGSPHLFRPSAANTDSLAARWESSYRRAVVLTDLVLIAVCLRVGLVLTDGSLAGHLPGALAGITAVVLLGSLFACRVWEQRILGQGAEELRRLMNGMAIAAVILGLTALAIDVGYFRPWVFGVLPVTSLVLLTARYALRQVLHTRRRRGLCMHPVLVAGSLDEVADLVERTRRESHYGWSVTGVCVPSVTGDDRPMEVRGVPVVGGLDDVPELARHGDYRVVALAPDAHWTRRRLRDLAWDLEGAPAELVVAPALMEVTGPRLHVVPVYGLTLLRVSQPTFQGARWVLKNVLDRVAASIALLLFMPLLVGITLAIKLEDGGPVLFRQERVGKAGRRFTMVKFRSMVVDAEWRRLKLEAANEGAGPLFKMRTDPRVTRVGAVLRRFSLDDLPQLMNVVVGDMSVVGPYPPRPAEVERYEFDARWGLLVKPGLTGLYQVSGRSDLSWEETARLNLRYVENWSLAMDAVIVWKAVGATLRGHGVAGSTDFDWA